MFKNISSDAQAIILWSMGLTELCHLYALTKVYAKIALLLRMRTESPTPICLWCYKLRRQFKSSVVIDQTQLKVPNIPDLKIVFHFHVWYFSLFNVFNGRIAIMYTCTDK